MTQLSLVIPQIGQPDTTEDVKIQNAFTAIQNVINGNIDSTNLSAVTAQSAAVNQSGQTVKGAVNIATSQSVTSTTYALMATPDQVTGIVLPTNGLIAVWYQATWQESVAGAARAAIFLGANQLKAAPQNTSVGTIPVVQETNTGSASTVNQNIALGTYTGGLTSEGVAGVGAYAGDVTTGQLVGIANSAGSCVLFAAAGTYTVSVQFKASSGSVTVSNRRLWVQALSFA